MSALVPRLGRLWQRYDDSTSRARWSVLPAVLLNATYPIDNFALQLTFLAGVIRTHGAGVGASASWYEHFQGQLGFLYSFL